MITHPALRFALSVGILCFVFMGLNPRRVDAHHPEDEVVRAIVDRAVNYLYVLPAKEWGRESLMGIAMIKAGVPKTHPRLQQSLKVVTDKLNKGLTDRDPPYVYPVALAAIFLIEMDDQIHRDHIIHCLENLRARQIADGGFAYPGQTVADVSQTQYAVLAFWLADKHDFNVPPEIGKAAVEYLMANQDPSGGFSYQGLTKGDRKLTHSMSAAGGGTLYIAASWLGYGQDAEAVARRPEEKDMPPSVRLVLIDEATGQPIDRRGRRSGGRGRVDLDEGRLNSAESRAEGWMSNNFTIRTQHWQYYYLYGYERYASFLEASKGVSDPEPEWYNQGVEFMRNTQQDDGSFPAVQDEQGSPEVSTAFAILFLVRSTKKTIGTGEYSDGSLLGGKGLSDEARTIMKGGRVVSLEVGRSVDDLKGLLSQTGDDVDFGQIATVDVLTIDESNPEVRDRQLVAIRNLVVHRNARVRWLAVRALGAHQDLDNIPPLIYALTDPDKDVVRFTNDSLLQIARKFDDSQFMLPDNFEPNDNRVEELRKRWVEWYFTVKPNGELYRPSL